MMIYLLFRWDSGEPDGTDQNCMYLCGDRMCDGMFDSISSLKHLDISSLITSPCYDSWTEDYRYILELCNDKRDMPEISVEDSTKLLQKMKPNVLDFWSVTPMGIETLLRSCSHSFLIFIVD